MRIDNELEQIAYFAAVDNILADKKLAGIGGSDEISLVSSMSKADRHFLDCVEALLILRKRGKNWCSLNLRS